MLFRPHSGSTCFQTGHVINGVVSFVGAVSSTCPNGAPPHQSWFTAKVVVSGKSVSIYKDDQLVRVVKGYYGAIGKGGVLLANGYDNTIRYKDFQIRIPHTVSSCKSVTKFSSYVQMVGGPGSWPTAGFCRTLMTKSVSGSDYSISVSLYNEKGRSNIGHLGILYNAKDMNNFDFVYFRSVVRAIARPSYLSHYNAPFTKDNSDTKVPLRCTKHDQLTRAIHHFPFAKDR